MADEAVAEVIEDIEPDLVESVDTEEIEDGEDIEVADSEDAAPDVEEPEPSESSPEKKDDGFQKRIDELTSRFYTEKQRADERERELEALRTQAPELEPGKTLADFEYDEGQFATYLTGLAKNEAKAEVERSIQSDKELKRRADFEMKEAGFAADAADYHTVTRNPALPISQAIVETLQTADKGPDVLYYLGKHPEVAASLAAMAPLDAARELGIIEATKLVKPEPSITKAPAPVPKIKGSDTSNVRVKSDSPESDKLSDEEWLKREQKRLGYK